MVSIILIATYIWSLFSIKHCSLHIWSNFDLANIMGMSVLQPCGNSGYYSKFHSILTYFSWNITLWSLYCMSAILRNIHTYTTFSTLSNFLGNIKSKMSDEKDGYVGAWGNLKSIMLSWLPTIRCNHIFKRVSTKHYLQYLDQRLVFYCKH